MRGGVGKGAERFIASTRLISVAGGISLGACCAKVSGLFFPIRIRLKTHLFRGRAGSFSNKGWFADFENHHAPVVYVFNWYSKNIQLEYIPNPRIDQIQVSFPGDDKTRDNANNRDRWGGSAMVIKDGIANVAESTQGKVFAIDRGLQEAIAGIRPIAFRQTVLSSRPAASGTY